MVTGAEGSVSFLVGTASRAVCYRCSIAIHEAKRRDFLTYAIFQNLKIAGTQIFDRTALFVLDDYIKSNFIGANSNYFVLTLGCLSACALDGGKTQANR